MWEVVWTDPDRESRKEHRERKATEREQKDKTRAARSSMSTRSSSSSDNKPFSFFGSKSLKRTLAPSTKSSALKAPSIDSTFRGSLLSAASEPPPAELPCSPVTTETTVDRTFVPENFIEDSLGSPSSNRDSVFSKWTDNSKWTDVSRWTDNSLAIPSSPCNTSVAESTAAARASHYVQTLGPTSYITKSTEVTILPRTADNDSAGMVSHVTITAEPVKEEPPTPPRSPAIEPQTPFIIDTPVNLFPGQPMPRHSLRRKPSWTTAFKPNNPDAWKPPDAWDCGPPPEVRTPMVEDVIEETPEPESGLSMSMDLNGMQREVRRMAAASTSIRLLRLKEVWGDTSDASLYKELEMEKKRWMLSSLHNMDRPMEATNTKNAPNKITPSKARKVLALYETQATTSYLAALHCSKKVYHLSSSPLSHTLFPNIHPIRVPAISPSAFPVAPSLFGAVYSLGLPALVPSPEVPGLLKNVHRCLSPGGTFHLTLIDPLPVTTTLGPLMRSWIEDNLVFNLEKNFRCMNPSKLFPLWMADASLRAEGSTITTVKFFAIPPTDKPDTATTDDEQLAERAIKQELRSLVGRMLWKEVWGQYITADKWWWEHDEIVDECDQLKTSWEYSIIEAVKEA
ncbi:hypothetical protein CkaCkLH20_11710 [Colletotrichum karsti]|uniref:Methyltransferase type 11 domain-containing protein n=1 Tax=Colletotrichum karsti TaxID=1095194 RepID=A0A9P6LF47_9PEZI|nr:uncharacterized protein CkaCkLH20_11710 [Colletotrichum karsti]KAF9870811.1 hypothetical protein CkaCkLH20_11710 [Colletotrichum karsti]